MDKLIHRADGTLEIDHPYVGKKFIYHDRWSGTPADPRNVVKIIGAYPDTLDCVQAVFTEPGSAHFRTSMRPYRIQISNLKELPVK